MLKKMSTKSRIIDYLRFRQTWCSGSELESQNENWQTKASTISRRARELADDDLIERLIVEHTVQYRIAPVIFGVRPSILPPAIKLENQKLFEIPRKRTEF